MDYRVLAHDMVQRQLRGRDIRDEAVLAAMRTAPRHRFVPQASLDAAYSDHALSIGDGQTISQPYVVARMTQLLRVEPGMKVLEIGTGSGYQTAVLAQMGAKVVSVERRQRLADAARTVLQGVMPDAEIEIIVADGALGYPAGAPYDRILVTAAAPVLPPAYQTQLGDGGRIVIPLGDRNYQTLAVIERIGTRMSRYDDIECRFVPLVGEGAWEPSD